MEGNQVPSNHRASPVPDPLEDVMVAYSMMNIRVEPYEQSTQGLFACLTGRHSGPQKLEFLDTEWVGRPGIKVYRMTVEDTVRLGRSVLPMIASGFNPRGVASLFLLAHQLAAPGIGGTAHDPFLFPDEPEITSPTDQGLDEFSEQYLHGNPGNPITATTVTLKLEAMAYSYIAATLFRLFTKPPSSYVRAWHNITSSFAKFYGSRFPVAGFPTPKEERIKALPIYFTEPRFKVALYRFLYTSHTNDVGLEMKRFLYDTHLEYTGLHIVKFFVQLYELLDCKPAVLLVAIHTRETERQIEALTTVLKMILARDADHRRGMWKYGRVFDETFMMDLMTKDCPRLVYMMAVALKELEPDVHRNILNIVQFADVPDHRKSECEAAAKRLICKIRKFNAAERSNGQTSHSATSA